MIKRIKEELLEARKAQDKFKKGILTALLSEVAVIGKNDGNRETTADEAISVITKFKKNINETLDVVKDPEKIALLEKERSIYDSFLPQSLSEEDTLLVIKEIISEVDNANVGMLMGKLKQKNIAGLDMALANKLARKELGV